MWRYVRLFYVRSRDVRLIRIIPVKLKDIKYGSMDFVGFENVR